MWRFRYYLKRSKLLLHYLFAPPYYETNGITLYFKTPYHHHIAYHESRSYEPEELAIWLAEITKHSLIFDVGGFNGFFGLVAARHNPKAHVLIFEPDPINQAHIKRNIDANNLTNCTLISAAATDYNGQTNFYGDGSTGSRIRPDGVPTPCTKLSDYGSPGLMKLDVERNELKALLGADLSATRTIIMETIPENGHAATDHLTSIAYQPTHIFSRNTVFTR